jgi:hypothetical protein
MPEAFFDLDADLHEEAEQLRREYEEARVSLDDFYAYLPMHRYVFAPTRQLWPASSVNARLGRIKLTDKNGNPVLDDEGKQKSISAGYWLDLNRSVEQMTWAPGLPVIIEDQLLLEGGWSDRTGVSCFNLYLGPTIRPGVAGAAGPWLDHVKLV